MRVFRIGQDCNRYRCFFELDPDSHVLDSASIGVSLADVWVPPPVYLEFPKLKVGDFLQMSDSYIVASRKATNLLLSLFQMAGELLPLPYEDEIYTVLNVTEVVDCLDPEKTIWADTGPFKMEFETMVFVPERLSKSPIFKIPERDTDDIFVTEGLLDPHNEFREIVRRERLKGLNFEEVWSSESAH
jgi:hypothetical protein